MFKDDQLWQLAEKIANGEELPEFLVLFLNQKESQEECFIYELAGHADTFEDALAIAKNLEKVYRPLGPETVAVEICLGFDCIPAVSIKQYAATPGGFTELPDADVENGDWSDVDYLYEKIEEAEFWLKGLEALNDDENDDLIEELMEYFDL